ncbi:MAG TPA: tetratricopeptide repeat protein [Candidatus Acidoferrales bacterium]|nr:tetratricopeptide repeat protein [Candidatus Acidoferrales bacterium]
MTAAGVVLLAAAPIAAAGRAKQRGGGGVASVTWVPGAQQHASTRRQNISAADATADWLSDVRKDVGVHDLAGALQIVDARLAAVPDDSDAMGWRARLMAWTGRRKEAEAEYRQALRVAPRDGDLLLGLATLLAQDGRNADALALLDAAVQIPPPRADVLNERGRVLRALKRRDEARAAFLQARALEPRRISAADDEALAGLRSLESPRRFEIDIGNETDTFNYTGAANAQTATFVAKPNARWIFSAEGDIYQRFGANAQKLIGAATYRFTPSDSFTVGAGGGNADGIIPRGETYFEYGHGFRISETKPLRGIETTYNQHWRWFNQASVLVFTGTVAADLAHDLRWTVSVNGARSHFTGAPVAWKPSGYTRLDFPLPRISADRLLMDLTFAVGSENFSEVDQVGAFASRTYGGGFRVGLSARQYVNLYVARQYRNGGNTEGIYGVSYGVRF